MIDKDLTTATPDTSASSVGESAAALAEWTIMIYQASDNDLADYNVRALTELKGVQTGDIINVIAQLDPSSPRMGTRRIVINRKDKSNVKTVTAASAQLGPSQLANDSVEVVPGNIRLTDKNRASFNTRRATGAPGPDMAEPETLFDFISWSQQMFPAKRYMLVLSGHSAGIETGFLIKDHTPPHSMSFTNLVRVLQAVKDRLNIKLDILGMDSCLMSMIEICYQVKELVGILVGAQSQIPEAGWPYKQILQELQAVQGKLEAKDFASIIIKKFVNFYLDNSVIDGLSVDLGALQVDESENVASAIRALARVLEGELGKSAFDDAIILSHWAAQSYNGELYVDLFDFCALLMSRYKDKNVLDACDKVQTAIKAMVLQSCFCGIDYQYSYGVSIYFPWSSIYSNYKDLDFANEEVSGWVKFLVAYVEKTRRQPRGGAGFRLLFDFRDDPPNRFAPPYQGLGPVVHSMRNPPDKYPDVTSCIEDEQSFRHLVGKFTLQ